MNTIIQIAIYNLKSLVRNLKSSGIMFILPIVFMFIFGTVFGSDNTSIEVKIGIYEVNNSTETFNIEDYLDNALKSQDSLVTTRKTFDSREKLDSAIKSKEIDIGIVVEHPDIEKKESQQKLETSAESTIFDLSEQKLRVKEISKFINNTSSEFNSYNSSPIVRFEIIYDEDRLVSSVTSSVIKDILTPIFTEGELPIEMKGVSYLPKNSKISSDFDILAPGLMIYGMVILIPGIAKSFTEITENKYIFRYSISKARSYQIIFGTLLFYLFVGTIQTFLLYFTAKLLGYEPTGNIFIALFPALASLLIAIGLGLFIGSFSTTTTVATNLGSIFSIILGFFSGSFIVGIGRVLEFKIFGQVLQFNDFIPTKWGTVAIEKILTYNGSLADIQLEMLILLSSGILIVWLGIIVFYRTRMRG